jgi:alkaline phosphatase D
MVETMQSRRRFLRSGGLLLGTAVGGVATGVVAANPLASLAFTQARNSPIHQLPARDYFAPAEVMPSGDGAEATSLTRIAFGSCANQDKQQPIWDAILAARPDLFLIIGDCIYGDTRDITHLREQYVKLATQPGLQRLRANSPVMAMWDDHDYGENDGGVDYPIKDQSRQAFLEFWQEPSASPRWSRNGIYTSRVFGPPGSRVQIIMPDLRYNRTPLTLHDLGATSYEAWEANKRASGAAVCGPYARCADRAATMLGDEQWQWFEQQLDVPAEIRIVASSLQVLADFPGWEAWINYACDHQRLIEVIRRKNASGVLFVSGDTHYAELSKLDLNVPYPLWDLTCSGLTEVWDDDVPNANRVGTMVREENFGMIEIDWARPDPAIHLKAYDRFGTAKIAKTLRLSQLTASSVLQQSSR